MLKGCKYIEDMRVTKKKMPALGIKSSRENET